MSTKMLATFGAGCFWGVEEHFIKSGLPIITKVGYGGGILANPTYEQVCDGTTGHTELIQITFDPSKVSYQKLLAVFERCHDAARPRLGKQYKSLIFWHNREQEKVAREWKAKNVDVLTDIKEFVNFYPAEEYHQRYISKQK